MAGGFVREWATSAATEAEVVKCKKVTGDALFGFGY
jgi:hypothetical protein